MYFRDTHIRHVATPHHHNINIIIIIIVTTTILRISCLRPDVATCYLMDTSKFHGPLYFVYPLLGIIMPILACITVISNTIIIVVLSR